MENENMKNVKMLNFKISRKNKNCVRAKDEIKYKDPRQIISK
jgi:hypothetical protein